MNQKTQSVFKAWLNLSEDEKREFVKEMLSYNSSSLSEQKAIKKLFEKE
jgi:hypothetical protein